jgi:hypothetical protein
VLAISLLVGFSATAVIVWLGIMKERHWDALREQARIETERAQVEAARANEAAGTAQERAAALEVEAAKASAEIAEARKQTAALEKDAAIARAAIADADKKASEAQQWTEAERLLRIKLEQQVAPRRISAENREGIAKELGAYAGKTVGVVSYSLDLESSLLAAQIIESLQLANITVDDNRASVMPLGGFVVGVHVTGPDDKIVQDIAMGTGTIIKYPQMV